MSGTSEKNRPDRSRSSGRGKLEYHVLPSRGGWAVRRAGDAYVVDLHATQAEAVQAARSLIQATGGELRIHDKNGRIARTFTLGRDNFVKIGAIEGIKPTRNAMIRTKEFDRKGLSSDERRRAIIEAYIPKG